MKKIGKAYGFFDCNALKEEIEKEIPTIRELVKTPSELELSLVEGVSNLKGNKKLRAIVKEAEKSEIRYVMEATYPDATNIQTADEVAIILNQVYNSQLYQDGEKFSGEIIYEDKGRYVFRE
ncbi:MAG: hypothetical protein AABX99_03145 [Nanoarchaeota archaeon]